MMQGPMENVALDVVERRQGNKVPFKFSFLPLLAQSAFVYSRRQRHNVQHVSVLHTLSSHFPHEQKVHGQMQ